MLSSAYVGNATEYSIDFNRLAEIRTTVIAPQSAQPAPPESSRSRHLDRRLASYRGVKSEESLGREVDAAMRCDTSMAGRAVGDASASLLVRQRQLLCSSAGAGS